MREDEPLEGWLFQVQLHAEHGRPPYPKGTGREALDRLAQALAAQPEGKVDYGKIRGGVISVYSPHWLSADEAADAQASTSRSGGGAGRAQATSRRGCSRTSPWPSSPPLCRSGGSCST